MIRRLLAVAAAVAVTVLPAYGAAAAPAGAPGIVVTGMQPSPGAVEFFVSGKARWVTGWFGTYGGTMPYWQFPAVFPYL